MSYTDVRWAILLSFAGCTVDVGGANQALRPLCVESTISVPAEGWVCGETLVLDCNLASVPSHIYVEAEGCDGVRYSEIDTEWIPGTHEIEVRNDDGDDVVCTSTLHIVDDEGPEVSTRTVSLWPPNHKYHAVSLEDCFETVDDCDTEWSAHLRYVSSDEPENARGDGNTMDDIVIVDDTTVRLRAERQGGSNGRVYTIGWTATDRSNNQTQGTCRVVVDHDQSGTAAIADAEAYRVTL